MVADDEPASKTQCPFCTVPVLSTDSECSSCGNTFKPAGPKGFDGFLERIGLLGNPDGRARTGYVILGLLAPITIYFWVASIIGRDKWLFVTTNIATMILLGIVGIGFAVPTDPVADDTDVAQVTSESGEDDAAIDDDVTAEADSIYTCEELTDASEDARSEKLADEAEAREDLGVVDSIDVTGMTEEYCEMMPAKSVSETFDYAIRQYRQAGF